MSDYIQTADDSEVIKQDQVTIDLDNIVDEYIILKAELAAIPDFTKSTPDQETLDFWNAEHSVTTEFMRNQVKGKATVLYNKVKPIVDAGLLPNRYMDQYNQLETFIKS